MSQPLDWTHDIATATGAANPIRRHATAAECQAMATALGLVACDGLAAEYKLKAASGDRIVMTGKVTATGQQACVVTGDPVAFKVDEWLDVEFTALPPQDDTAQDEHEVLSLKDIEMMEGGVIDAGRIIYETVSVCLDPYPRRPGVALPDQAEIDADDGDTHRPFAALGKLKKPS